jgi:DNA-binding MarR family transcriptional regulator
MFLTKRKSPPIEDFPACVAVATRHGRCGCAGILEQFGPETIVGMPMAIDLRPSQALKLLQDFNYALVTDGEADLSARQLAILLTIYLQPPPHTVRGLAAKLKVTKPVITRALDSMGKLGLVSRRRDEADKRNVVIQRTPKGALAVERLGDVLIAKAKELPR